MAKTLINEEIRAPKLRVIDQNGDNLGELTRSEALSRARSASLDLIEVSPNATPPVAKIGDFGKYQYDMAKKQKEIKAKANITETKNIQLTVGIGENDMMLKARNCAEWLKEGHRVKIELQLKGREKYMDEKFLRERFGRMLAIIPNSFKIAEAMKKTPKSLMIVLEKDK